MDVWKAVYKLALNIFCYDLMSVRKVMIRCLTGGKGRSY